jgi:hypothetical protein
MPSQAVPTGHIDAPQPAVSVNGTAPGAAAEDCAECVSSGERALAVVGVLIGLGIVLIAIDLGTGGKLSGLVGLGQKEAATHEPDPGT